MRGGSFVAGPTRHCKPSWIICRGASTKRAGSCAKR